MARAALTPQQIAALAAGSAVQGAAAAAPAAAAAAPAATTTEPAAPAATTTTTEPAAAAPAAAAPAAPDQSAIVAYLQGQLATSQAATLAAQVELAAVKEKVTTLEATHTALTKIAAQSVSNMRIALGLSAVDLSAMTSTALLAEHSSTEETFKKSFPVGGVSAASAQADESTENKVNASEWSARVAATQLI